MKRRVLRIAVGLLVAAGCQPAERKLTRASYDPSSARLILLSADQNGDGAIDQWTYLDGNRPLRGEGDTDGDGRIDRWEYFDANGQLTRVGTSTLNDGVEDSWTWVTPINGEARIDRSRRRDRQIDRHEFYNGETLVRVEEDANADGRVDKWERYEGGRLIEASFDTTLTRGRADRRLTYDASGRAVSVAMDPEGDGTFVTVQMTRDKGNGR
jgi:hypothetical protein